MLKNLWYFLKTKPTLVYALLLAIIVNVVFVYFMMIRPAQEEKRLLATGLPGRAIIRDIQTTGVMVNRQPRVLLKVEVHPEQGIPYEAEFKQVISPVHLPKFQPGGEFKIKIDPKNKNNIYFESVIEKR